MKLPKAKWQQRPGMAALLDALGAADGLSRYVGGCVRDTALGLPVSDVDLATSLEPGEVIRRLEGARIKAVPTGIAHGTVTAVSAGTPVEVTTLRRDVTTDGRRATIAFTDDWREDAGRRDFTINALSANPVSHEIFDYFGGLEDLEGRLVRFIGDPLSRIAEDHLRILRFFRFHARFGNGPPHEESRSACAARANDLMALSRERIADELLKLLNLPAPAETVALMIQAGIFRPVLPEIADPEPLHRLIERERLAGAPPDAIRRLAALLPRDPELAEAIAARLRLSNKQARRLASAATAQLELPRALAYRIGTEEAIDRILLHGGDLDGLAALADWRRPFLPIKGGDLVRAGITAGPEVARLLRRIEERWIAEYFPSEERVRAIMAEEVGR